MLVDCRIQITKCLRYLENNTIDMKRNIILLLGLVTGLLFYGSCKKDNTGDGTPPVIEILGANPLYWALDEVYVDPGATAWDITQEGDTVDISASINSISTVDVSQEGDYTVTYRVTDGSGLSADEKVRNVKVVVGK